MTLEQLKAHYGELGTNLVYLRPLQQQQIADAAFEEGFAEALIALETDHASLAHAMQLSGYEVCKGQCAAWFPHLELTDGLCEDCGLTADFVREPEPEPEPQPAESTEPVAISGN